MSSRSLNRIQLIGNLTRDPELKYTPNGTAVCTFGLATNRSWTTADGQTKDEVQYHRVVSWQKLAELTGKLLAKGKKVYVEGRITYRSFVGKDGVQRNITEIVMDDFIVFDSFKRTEGGEGQSTSPAEQQSGEGSPAPSQQDNGESLPPTEAKKDETVNPDDIPF